MVPPCVPLLPLPPMYPQPMMLALLAPAFTVMATFTLIVAQGKSMVVFGDSMSMLL